MYHRPDFVVKQVICIHVRVDPVIFSDSAQDRTLAVFFRDLYVPPLGIFRSAETSAPLRLIWAVGERAPGVG